MTTNETKFVQENDTYCLCEIKDKTNYICVNCNKLCVLNADESTNTSNNYSNTSIKILTIDQPFENKLDYFIKKKHVKCIILTMFILFFAILAFLLYIVHK